MKLDKLLKRLKRDLAASPQKAGALGLMMLVALYFWAPLVLKWGKGKAKSNSIAVSQVILTDDPVLAKAVPHPATDSGRWEHVRQAIATDQMMVPATHHVSWSNPFSRLREPPKTENEVGSTEPVLPHTPQVATPEPTVDKEHLAGVMISSILLGKRHAVVIRGTVYRINDQLSLGGEDGKPALELRIVGIDESGIDLTHQGKTYRIERLRPKLSPGDHVRQE
ncbi:hypothetical protein ETAA8_38860 [Anatilimnocola aggregata]|uniref:Uncharacterized protein n=1 Tax=Anatilimnocola aggregata TaxID=2528021 RepID=A0A517YF03_9BACT|nr:hypothetical protein [Anatilimnocola aggregata]QDU28781.1 hypothetical protein ETAA8_38860 [Anatilimnocola aggregata]